MAKRKLKTSPRFNLMREAAIRQYMESFNNGDDDGGRGRAFEVSTRPSASRRIKCATQDKADSHIRVDGIRYTAECKTGGGRVGGEAGRAGMSNPFILASAFKTKDFYASGCKTLPRYVIYWYIHRQKRKADKTHSEAWYKETNLLPIVVPTDLFISKLLEFGALGWIGNKRNSNAIVIKLPNKRLQEWVENYPVPFVKDWDYTASDFEDLE